MSTKDAFNLFFEGQLYLLTYANSNRGGPSGKPESVLRRSSEFLREGKRDVANSGEYRLHMLRSLCVTLYIEGEGNPFGGNLYHSSRV